MLRFTARLAPFRERGLRNPVFAPKTAWFAKIARRQKTAPVGAPLYTLTSHHCKNDGTHKSHTSLAAPAAPASAP